MDFNDMIPLCIHLLRQRPDVLADAQEKYRYIFCDEFQGDIRCSRCAYVAACASSE